MDFLTIDQLIAARHGELVQRPGLDSEVLLHTIAEVESGHGLQRLAPRHERAYCYGSDLYRGVNGADLREQSYRYGCLAHMSYGSWQVMFINAYDMGFRGDPIELREDAALLPWLIKFVNRRILSQWPSLNTVAAFADAYNSGNPNDSIVPMDYIGKFDAAYSKWWKSLRPPEVLRT